MSQPTYEIVFRGKLLRDFDRATVVSNLMALFRTDAARVEAMLGQQKLVLKRGLGKDAAIRYQDVLRQAGIMVAAIAEAAAEPASASASPASAPAPAAGSTTPPAPAPAPVTANAAAADAASGLTLAAVGTPVLENPAKPAARSFDLSAFSLDAPGVILVEKPAPPRRSFDTSLLELAPQPEPEPDPQRPLRSVFDE